MTLIPSAHRFVWAAKQPLGKAALGVVLAALLSIFSRYVQRMRKSKEGEPSGEPGVSGDFWVKMEKEMATHSSVLAWRIPGTGQPGGLSSMGSHRVGHN